jgi:tetratricopeptide (TPR) repeat protein
MNRMDGYSAAKRGYAHFLEQRWQEALDCFDEAIDFGFKGGGRASDDGVYSLRGTCLKALGFDLDAIDDFNKAIELNQEDCNGYFQRAFCKKGAGDIAGCVGDLQEAVRLSEVDSDLNREYNVLAKKQGSQSATSLYMAHLLLAESKLKIEKLLKRGNCGNKARRIRKTRDATEWHEDKP